MVLPVVHRTPVWTLKREREGRSLKCRVCEVKRRYNKQWAHQVDGRDGGRSELVAENNHPSPRLELVHPVATHLQHFSSFRDQPLVKRFHYRLAVCPGVLFTRLEAAIATVYTQ